METISKEYKERLNELQEISLKDFLKKFKALESYKEREPYLNENICKEIKGILQREEYLKLYYLQAQADYIRKELKIKDEFINTLVYTYNSNSGDFDTKIKEQNLKKDLIERGFKEISPMDKDLKQYDGLKVLCVLDVNVTGIMGSLNETIEQEGKLLYQEHNNSLMLIPKRNRTRGFLIKKRAFIKEVKKW